MAVEFAGPAGARGDVVWQIEQVDDPPPTPQPQKYVRLRIDSNNDGSLTAADDLLKNSQPADVIINNTDADADYIPDYADGFTFPGVSGNHATSAGVTFKPLQVTLSDGVDVANATLTFDYRASDPAAMTMRESLPGAKNRYALAADALGTLQGEMRLWTRDGGSGTRNPADVTRGGDFVKPGTSISAAALGFTSTNRTITLYVEAVDRAETYGSNEPIKVTMNESGTPVGTFDSVILHTLYNGPGWEALSEQMSGFDLSTWNPSLSFADNHQNLCDIYGFYRYLYRLNPTKFLWAGGAKTASGTVFYSLNLLDEAIAGGNLASSPAFIGIPGGLPTGAILSSALPPVRTELMKIAYKIFSNIGWQHLAYQYGGIQEIHRLGQLGDIPDGTGFGSTVNVVAAWDQIDLGTPSSIWRGGLDFVDHEQNVVVASNYITRRSLWIVRGVLDVPTFLTWASQFRDPLPGMQTFWAWRATKANGASLYVTTDAHRWAYMNSVLWPFWTSLTTQQKEKLINTPPDELAQ